MPAWPQRRDAGTPPAQRVEHALRYALAAPLIDGAVVWADLGAGDGVAQAAGLGPSRARRTVLVDRDEDAARRALRELGGEGEALAVDLSSAAELKRLSTTIKKGTRKGAKRVVTCFSTIEQLDGFAALLEELRGLAGEGFDVLFCVPNTAFEPDEDPERRSVWGVGSVAELRPLLPDGAVLLRQVALAGSAIGSFTGDLAISVDDAAGVATSFVVAFGPRADALVPAAALDRIDLDAQRTWERRRDTSAALTPALMATNAKLGETIARHDDWVGEWRTYIHELETKLGLPLSGVSGESHPPQPPQLESPARA